ncbi:MAG: hypothetical protein ACYDD1_12430 [Caulobacteraceae bacterium]
MSRRLVAVLAAAVLGVPLSLAVFVPGGAFLPKTAEAHAHVQDPPDPPTCNLAAEIGAPTSERDTACHDRWKAQLDFLATCKDMDFYLDPAEGGRRIVFDNGSGDWYGASSFKGTCPSHHGESA